MAQNSGSPLASSGASSKARARGRLRALAYTSLIDFVPDHEPYEHLTIVDITPAGNRSNVVMTVDPMHDEMWTQRILSGRNNELDNLQAAVARRT